MNYKIVLNHWIVGEGAGLKSRIIFFRLLNFFPAAPAPDCFPKLLRVLIFLLSGSGSKAGDKNMRLQQKNIKQVKYLFF